MKARTKRKLFYFGIGAVLAAMLAVICVPPLINFDRLKPQIESAVRNQTGINIDIRGHVRLSLLGRATLTATQVAIAEYDGFADSVSFYIPFRSLDDINTASINSTIIIDGARLNLSSLSAPAGVQSRIIFRNGSVVFAGKTYDHIDGVFKNGIFNGVVRTQEHKYTLESDGDNFRITNPNIKLDIVGQLASDDDGNISAYGEMALESDDINKWFEFDVPKIKGRVKFKSDFLWGDGIFLFSNIKGELDDGDFAGGIEFGRGRKKISIVADNLDYDFSFLHQHPEFLNNSEINFAGNGRLTMSGMIPTGNDKGREPVFNRIKIQTASDSDTITVKEMVLEGPDFSLSAFGRIAKESPENLDISFWRRETNESIHCILSGRRGDWSCARWDYANADFAAGGTLTVNPDEFQMQFASDNLHPESIDISTLNQRFSTLFDCPKGTIGFRLANGMIGTVRLDGKNTDIEYSNHADTTLNALPAMHDFLKLLPKDLMKTRGVVENARILNGKLLSLDFLHNGRKNQWSVGIDDQELVRFYIDARYLLSLYYPNLDAKFLRAELPMSVTGHYKSGYIPDINITITGDHAAEFSGKFDGRKFDLHADILDMDELIDRNYIEQYESARYVSAEPLTFPFLLGMNLTMSADRIKFGNEVYDNFNYSLKPESQKMSVTDAARGSVLLSIDKKSTKYNLLVQSNRFEIMGLVLPSRSPLNVADTVLTAQAELATHGITAYDFWANMSGSLDLAFDGGTLVGFDIDRFYANAKNITKMNAEYAISDALSGGTTKLKSLHLAGRYENGGFQTTVPLSASARHSEITGKLQVRNGKMAAQLQVLLRATSPKPLPISLDISRDGERDYSLSEIMLTLDPDYMREFVKTHDKF
ncbi:MAG: AsmA family protein [Rickettsiales bacterium]|jgi:hypothetical protein|nr:AsmA family protein [Rickettsiales bacterium]